MARRPMRRWLERILVSNSLPNLSAALTCYVNALFWEWLRRSSFADFRCAAFRIPSCIESWAKISESWLLLTIAGALRIGPGESRWMAMYNKALQRTIAESFEPGLRPEPNQFSSGPLSWALGCK